MEAPQSKVRAGHASVVLLGGVVGVVGGSLLPWVRSGATDRNSYESLRSAQRLDLVESETVSTALQLWYVMPVVAALVTVGLALHYPRLATVAAGTTAVLAAVCSVVALQSGVPVGAGPVTCLVGSVVLAVGTVLYARSHPTCASCAVAFADRRHAR